jgi:hypothetical protein
VSAGVVQRIEFAPALFTRELAAYYLSKSLREVDDLRASGDLIPVGDGKRITFTKAELDGYVDGLKERPAKVRG